MHKNILYIFNILDILNSSKRYRGVSIRIRPYEVWTIDHCYQQDKTIVLWTVSTIDIMGHIPTIILVMLVFCQH